MIYLTADTPILVAREPVDFRKGIDGFAAVCQQALRQHPRSGTRFVFINRAAPMVRVLTYENNGYWLMTKRLSKGRYLNWPKAGGMASTMQAHALRRLLSGE